MKRIDVEHIRQKVKTLVKSMGISKTKLGEILGRGNQKEDPRVKINRATRFLSGAQKRIALQDINALAKFFDRPTEWFLFDQIPQKMNFALSSSEKHSPKPPKEIQEIQKSLKNLGLDKKSIKTIIKQIEAIGNV